MRKAFELPDLGEGIAEAELISWAVAEGDRVEEDEVIAEVETDKALVELPSPYDGEIAELRAEVGEIVPVDEELVVFEVEGDEEAEEAPSPESEREEVVDEEPEETDLETDEPAPEEASAPTQPPFATPRVRRIARELGVDLASLHLDGHRVTERDVRAAAGEDTSPVPDTTSASRTQSPSGSATPEPTSERTTSETAGREQTLAVPATRRIAREQGIDIDDVPASEERDGEAFVTAEDVRSYSAGDRQVAQQAEPAEEGPRPGTRVPYTGIRRTIGERMAESKYTAPHVSHHDEVEVSALVDTRERLKDYAEERGVRLTYLPFGVKAAVAALKEVPAINAELDEEAGEIILHDEYHIGIAVATDAGLMVPVIEHADQKDLFEIAREIEDKATRARERTLDVSELQGSTFTITNVGTIGGQFASPIINYPEAAILALGSLEERPWVVEGEVVARPVMPISMTSDHRIVDGIDAANFTNALAEYLRSPERLLLE